MTERTIRVLHLEDSVHDAELVGHKLKTEGVSCEIELTTGRQDFEAALAQTAFDLILCDYNLPGYDGLSALLRAKEARPDAPVIIISGSVGEEEAVRCLHAGATDYLLKQHLERLAPAVRRAIQEAEERRKLRQAEEALFQRERRLSLIIETVADVLFYLEVEPDGRYRFVSINRAFTTTTGLTREQILGKRVDEVIPEPSLSLALEKYQKAIREKQVVQWEETSDYPTGTLTGEVSITPVFDASGRCTHIVGAVHDVTERRRLEAQLRQAQKMESIGQLAGGIAHDFNNLLTVIDGMAELALLQAKDGDPQLQEDLREIRRAGARAAALTKQLLAFSHKQILQPQVLSLNRSVAEMEGMILRLIGENVTLVLKPAQHAGSVKADPGQLEQVIANLAVNAREAMPHAGTLTIETRNVDIGEEYSRENGVSVAPGAYVALSITDTGCGMNEATRRQIFEPFFTTKSRGKGIGLGLSTVYGIVRQSGGFIQVETAVGRGSSFTVYLPRVPEPASSPRSGKAAAAARGSETILVVEDVAGLRGLITRTLQGAGYSVLNAASGDEALEVLEQHQGPVHLMVTDVVMPGMSGRILAERLERTHPDMKVIYTSGYTDDVIVRHGVLDDKVEFIGKPFATADLIRKIRGVLDGPPKSPSSPPPAA